MDSKRMPKLVIDEVILLVDTYFQLEGIKDSTVKKDLIDELSKNMRKLPFFPDIKDDESFRSPDGMRMCLANIGYIDPNNTSKFGHGSALQRRVFDYYRDKKKMLRKIAMAIISLSKDNIKLDPIYADNIYGQIIASYHKHLEMTDKVVNRIYNENKKMGQTICGLCGNDLSKTYYGAENLMEVHINMSIEDYASTIEIYPSDTIFICPTCHKLIHMDPRLYLLDHAKEKINVRK